MDKQRSGIMWTLHVPGLAENRPSVLKGDEILVQDFGSDTKTYVGKVEEVKESQLLLKFNDKFVKR